MTSPVDTPICLYSTGSHPHVAVRPVQVVTVETPTGPDARFACTRCAPELTVARGGEHGSAR